MKLKYFICQKLIHYTKAPHCTSSMNMASVLRSSYSRCISTVKPLNSFATRALSAMAVKVGDNIPKVDLFEATPANSVCTADLCNGKKVLIFAVPGAFTPGCSKTHLPGYISKIDEIKGKGISEIVCYSINDPFVMSAWGKEHGTDEKIRMLADTNGDFTKALGLGQDLAVLGGLRPKRFSMVVDNGKITHLNVEPDGKGLTCSLAENTIPLL